MDKVQFVRELETINSQLLKLCYELMGAAPGTEEAEALDTVSDAIMCLENYLYPEVATWSDEDIFLDDGE